MKKKLVIIGPVPPPFMGPAVATKRFIESEILNHDFEVVHFDTTDKEGIEDIGLLNSNNIKQGLRHAFGFLKLLFSQKPDAVYISIARGLWGFIRDLFFIVPAKIFFTKVVVHLRAGRFDIIHDNGWFGKFLAKIGLGLCDKALVLGETVKNVFGNYIKKEKVEILSNGMNLSQWNYEQWVKFRQARNPESNGEYSIACISNLYHDKGVHVLLMAMPSVVKVFPKIKLVVAGDWQGIDYDKLCYEIIRKNSLENNVSILKRVDDTGKKEILKNADIAVFVPVAPEGLPWVVLEAMSAALPVIGTSQGTMKEVIQDLQTGYIINSNDHSQLSEKIIYLLQNPVTRYAMGAVGRQRVENIYSEPVVHKNLANIINRVCER